MTTTTGLTVTDLAYVAALIDTRATFTSRQVRDTVLPQVAISGKPFPVLQWLGDITGVRVVPTEREYVKAGCAEHCLEKHQHIKSASGRWCVAGVKATVVLAAVQPYLRLQPAEVDELLAVGLKAGRKNATVEKMRALGWPIPNGLEPRPTGDPT